jgi:drug/metabolite transporter (DMT)-like permease
MSMPAQIGSASFSLTAMLVWGISDFVGGYAARRANAFFLTAVSHAGALTLMVLVAWLTGAPFPGHTAVGWALAAGSAGGMALAVFYRALASGKMGLTAPVAAVLGAGIPTAFSMTTEGLPGAWPIAGFALAGLGIWLISRSEDGSQHPEGLWMAALAGVGFAGFYICIKQAGDGSALWMAAVSRSAALVVTAVFVLAGRQLRDLPPPMAAFGVFVGCLDVTGSAMFIRSSQLGRLDAAVVLSSLYPAVTVLMARLILQEHLTHWKAVGMLAALAAVPMIAW